MQLNLDMDIMHCEEDVNIERSGKQRKLIYSGERVCCKVFKMYKYSKILEVV